MRTEKELTHILKLRKHYSEKNQTRLVRIKNWFLAYRLNLRQTLNGRQWNFSTFLTFVPIALGFSHFFIHYLNAKENISFFKTNFPVFKTFYPKINLETVEYIVKPNSFSTSGLSKVQQHKVLFSSDTNFFFGQPQFLAKINKQPLIKNEVDPKKIVFRDGDEKTTISLDTQKFSGLSCDFYMIPSGNFCDVVYGNGFTRDLDELPSYLNGFKQNLTFSEALTLFSTKENVGIRTTLSSKPEKKEARIEYTLFSDSEEIKNTLQLAREAPLVHKKNFFGKETGEAKLISIKLSESFSVKNKFYKNRFDFYTEANKLQTHLLNLFLEKRISCFQSNFVEKQMTTFEFLEDDDIIEKILQDLEKKHISKDLIVVRTMSGYNYPDTNTRDLERFFIKNRKLNDKKEYTKTPVFAKVKGVKLETVSFPSFTKNYRFNIKDLPKILIQTQNVLLTNPENNQVVYNGPSLVLNSQKPFDWETDSPENLRSWFHKYLSPSNPLVQIRENFFGNYFSPELLIDKKTPKLLINKKTPNFPDFATTSFLRLKLTRSKETDWLNYKWVYESDPVENFFAPSTSSLQVPSETSKPDDFFKQENFRGITLKVSKPEDPTKIEQFFPLLELKQPFLKDSIESSKRFTGYTSLFEFGVKGNPDSSFSPLEKNFIQKQASGRYKKISSINSKKRLKKTIFVKNWEPLTATSWLAVSQLSFALFIFNILKSLADNYGRELLGYLLNLVAALGFLDASLKKKIEIITGKRNKGFRVVLESRKNFTDIVGIQKLLLEVYEIVLFLRNSAREFTLSKTLPHGVLLTGPPGTGKTLLVQAIAGEAQVPVIMLSGSSLIAPGEPSAIKLQMAFQEARQLAPCIVFIDEIDTFAAKRSQMLKNPMAIDKGFESFLESLIVESNTSFQTTPLTSTNPLGFDNGVGQKNDELIKSGQKTHNLGKQGKTLIHSNSDQREKKLSLLSQLLIELAGIQGRNGVVVIGASNRPEVLDPALIRPGRFDKIIDVGLPEQKKRVEILQFYGQALGYENEIPWDYLGERTVGFTAADLATLMNESTIKAILNQSTHTIQTIEHGIDRLTTSESEKYTIVKTKKNIEKKGNFSISSKMAIIRLAYYQAGKIVLSSTLETHPKSVVACLWPRRPTIRSVQIATNLQSSFFNFARLCEMNERLVGCYSGKAAEFLFLQKFSAHGLSKSSTLGLEDVFFGQKLVYFMLKNCEFYSKKSLLQQTITLPLNLNPREFRENPEKLDLYNELVERIELPPMWEALEAETSSLRLKQQKENIGIEVDEQLHYSIGWWREEILDEAELKPKNPGKGSRLYLYDPERTLRNPEWFPPDEFYHRSSSLKNVKRAFANIQEYKRRKKENSLKKKPVKTSQKKRKISVRKTYFPFFGWNDVSKLTRDYPAHSLVLQSFNHALVVLNQNRELLDRLVVELVYQEILRKPDIEKLLKKFEIRKSHKLTNELSTETLFKPKNQIALVESPWGVKSRKPLPRWIDFVALREETS